MEREESLVSLNPIPLSFKLQRNTWYYVQRPFNVDGCKIFKPFFPNPFLLTDRIILANLERGKEGICIKIKGFLPFFACEIHITLLFLSPSSHGVICADDRRHLRIPVPVRTLECHLLVLFSTQVLLNASDRNPNLSVSQSVWGDVISSSKLQARKAPPPSSNTVISP